MGQEMKKVIIIGGGPAGLTAAYELLKHGGFKPYVIEMEKQPGGISRTVRYKDFRMDIGGHRFFSKSDEIMNWWQSILKPAGSRAADDISKQRNIPVFENGPDPEKEDKVMLIRKRLSRILYERKYYSYPISVSFQLFKNIGFVRSLRVGVGYLSSCLRKIRPEKTLEHFLINRFGKPLYEMFFKSYTHKVWGKRCDEIEATWGHQRIKGLSLVKALLQPFKAGVGNIAQKDVETSLISYFLYPKFGPGQLWEEVADRICDMGGDVVYSTCVDKVVTEDNVVRGVETKDLETGETSYITGDYVISTMAVKDFVASLSPPAPHDVARVASTLPYRDFLTVGMLIESQDLINLDDNWIYIQEKDVQVGRIQIFNNWSPYMVSGSGVWIGLEYFCMEGDDLWTLTDEEMKAFAIKELLKLGFINNESSVKDGCVIRVPKAYPAYWDGYHEFYRIQEYTDSLENLFLVGRNGMHRYNNQDHSMLTAIEAVNNIVSGIRSKENIWQVNTEAEYHESGKLGS